VASGEQEKSSRVEKKIGNSSTEVVSLILLAMWVCSFPLGLWSQNLSAGGSPDESNKAIILKYKLVDLGTLGVNTVIGYGLNNRGDVTGDAYSPIGCTDEQTFLYTNKTKMVNMNGLQPGFAGCNYGVSINDSGQIAFNQDQPFHTGSGDYTAHRYTPNVGVIDLGTLPGDIVSYATHINLFGEVVGGSVTNDPPDYLLGHPFLYSDDGGMVDLGSLGGGRGMANGINARGTVVGWSRTPNTPVGDYWDPGDAFVWTVDIHMVDLNTINKTPGWNLRNAAAVNGQGIIVGFGLYNKVDLIQAFRYNPNTRTVLNLGTFPGGGFSYALDINSKGWVVGAAYLDASGIGNYRACVWPKGLPVALNLNKLIPQNTGWTLAEARAINDFGQILAWGFDVKGNTHAFRLDPK
jgi:probable HAF family extracellular repeat protein